MQPHGAVLGRAAAVFVALCMRGAPAIQLSRRIPLPLTRPMLPCLTSPVPRPTLPAVPHLLATVLAMGGPRTQTIVTNEFRSQASRLH